jgi:hypothetical protein
MRRGERRGFKTDNAIEIKGTKVELVSSSFPLAGIDFLSSILFYSTLRSGVLECKY